MDHTHRSYSALETDVRVSGGPWALWHEDAISAPETSVVHARVPHADAVFSEGRAWGLQVHIEFTSDIVERLGQRMGVAENDWRPLVESLDEETEDIGPRVASLLDLIWSRMNAV